MIRLVISCLWVCIVTLGSAYAVFAMKTNHSDAAAPTAQIDKTGYDKTRSINIPMISKGAVQGYVIVQFSYTTKGDGKKANVPIDAFILDEAFKTLYADEKLDFKHLERYDVASLTKNIITKVNTRLNTDALKDVLVEEFNYISKEDISR